jgi:hypothetical protein
MDFPFPFPSKECSSQTLIECLRPQDVLMGRGAGPTYHSGNGAFRFLIEANVDVYYATNSRIAKTRLSHAMVHQIKANRGRFLLKLGKVEKAALGIEGNKTLYTEVDETTAAKKAKQTFRYVHKTFAAKKVARKLKCYKKKMIERKTQEPPLLPTRPSEDATAPESALPIKKLQESPKPRPVYSDRSWCYPLPSSHRGSPNELELLSTVAFAIDSSGSRWHLSALEHASAICAQTATSF